MSLIAYFISILHLNTYRKKFYYCFIPPHLLSLSSFNSTPFFSHSFLYNSSSPSIFSFLCANLSLFIYLLISLSISPPPPPPPSLSLTNFLLRSYALTFFLYCFPFHFLSLSFVLPFSPCTYYYPSLPVL